VDSGRRFYFTHRSTGGGYAEGPDKAGPRGRDFLLTSLTDFNLHNLRPMLGLNKSYRIASWHGGVVWF
jgi:hypothetical protein